MFRDFEQRGCDADNYLVLEPAEARTRVHKQSLHERT